MSIVKEVLITLRITCLVTRSTLLPPVVLIFSIVVLVYLLVVLVYPLEVLECSLEFPVCQIVCPLVVLVYPLVAVLCPIVVSVCLLVLLVALSIGLFITDHLRLLKELWTFSDLSVYKLTVYLRLESLENFTTNYEKILQWRKYTDTKTKKKSFSWHFERNGQERL